METNITNILIVEDQIIIAADLSEFLESVGFNVVDICSTGEAALEVINREEVDIVIMDINLQGKLTGIDTVKLLRYIKNITVIYLTAYADDSTFEEAKNTHPFAFMSKPFVKKEIKRTLELAEQKIEENRNKVVETHDLEEDTSLTDRIFLKDGEKLVRIYLKDICIVKADRAYCSIITQEKTFTLSMPMKEFAERVKHPLLQQIHRSHIVNVSNVSSLRDNVIEISGEQLVIGKSYKDAFLKNFKLLK